MHILRGIGSQGHGTLAHGKEIWGAFTVEVLLSRNVFALQCVKCFGKAISPEGQRPLQKCLGIP